MAIKSWRGFVVVTVSLCLYITNAAAGQQGRGLEADTTIRANSDDELASGIHCPSLPKLPILLGRGWDNLMNKEMGQLTQNTYRHCKTTDDGQLLIPDIAFVIPIRQSSLGLRSELIDHFSNYTEITSHTINVQAQANGESWSASGSFSYENQLVKEHQVEDKTVTSRVSFRTTLYVIGYEPSAKLDPTFKSLLLNAAAVIEDEMAQNMTTADFTGSNSSLAFTSFNKSNFLLEMIVRDYGTHVLSRIDLGAVIYKEDFLSRDQMLSDSTVRQAIQVAASASFGKVFRIGANYSQAYQTMSDETYENFTKASYVKSIGGGQLFTNMTIDSWIDTVASNLVAVDRAGDPIYFLVTPQALPELSMPVLRRLSDRFQGAVRNYYAHNSRYGCTQMDSPNFDFHANVADGSCKKPEHNYTLGGLFERCIVQDIGNGNICETLQDDLLKNPKTGSDSCPEGYNEVPLLSKEKYTEWKLCYNKGFWISYTVCETYQSSARINAYWCAAKGGHNNKTGYMFGGLYSSLGSKQLNPVTNARSCPPTFFDLHLYSANLHVCIGDDDLGRNFEIEFGGFMSCQYGNALYTDLNKVTLLFADAEVKAKSTGRINGWSRPPADLFTHNCPSTFTQHVAEIIDGCEINYCMSAKSFRLQGRIPINRPPFHDIAAMYAESAKGLPSGDDSKANGSYSVLIIGIVVAVIVGLVTIALIWRKRSSAQRRSGYTEIPTATLGGENENRVTPNPNEVLVTLDEASPINAIN